MSTFESARERLGSKGVVPSLLTLFSADDVTVKTLCLAALQNVSSAEDKTCTHVFIRQPFKGS